MLVWKIPVGLAVLFSTIAGTVPEKISKSRLAYKQVEFLASAVKSERALSAVDYKENQSSCRRKGPLEMLQSSVLLMMVP